MKTLTAIVAAGLLAVSLSVGADAYTDFVGGINVSASDNESKWWVAERYQRFDNDRGRDNGNPDLNNYTEEPGLFDELYLSGAHRRGYVNFEGTMF